MADDARIDPYQQQQQQKRVGLPAANTSENGVHSKPGQDAPLDFSVKREHVTPMTSSQAAVMSLPVAPPPLPVLFPQLVDPAVMSALSAAGLLLRPPPTTPVTTRPGDVTEQVRAYVQSKIAEEQRRLQAQRASLSSSSSSPSVDSSAERTATSPVRSSPTSTTTPPSGFDALPQHWPPLTVIPPLSSVVSEPSPSLAAAGGSRKRLSSYTTDTSSTSKDVHYWERRRKNNEAAKRSRDARRAKEEEVALRASALEHENRQLRVELTAFRLEVARLSELLCRQVAQQSSAPPTAAAPSQNNSPR